MSGFGSGTHEVPLIGTIGDHERQPGYFDWLLRRARPEVMRRIAEARRRLEAVEYRGRPRKLTVTEAAWVTDKAELRSVVLLCWTCQHKFDHRRYHYHKDTRWQAAGGGVLGVCDGCRDNSDRKKQMFIHESLIGKGVGQSYIPE